MAAKKNNLDDLFQSLEEITEEMESEEISLEDSFTLYKKGMDILKKCNEKIEGIEKKIQILDDEGETHEFE
ncbi:exodeoxyribonuclease VII small subunit [Aequitasia blattaphilus]|uniref:Exodeoxyribonuclease 7 small subunit n=1 Tax=Aequitasia blattaphilus TaxID=2949332 RepID=A0ABT1E5P9_9FIRM|nr:exodeoxyribonuclease VII small subunit [Aequitasia blattaphilus]MCP1101161.1 exodeoxyribonuclease VII small subunit [Aequitasia blattaphilus]MCR8613801.1 exodeoxyribonuclease VII small subunit [Aequitasia blattaphilus]